ncbi:MAG: hypothetical protein O2791_04325 [Bacteroidetes bacterium]|nr:hypothetical protein [Bacteroidota bacterium]
MPSQSKAPSFIHPSHVWGAKAWNVLMLATLVGLGSGCHVESWDPGAPEVLAVGAYQLTTSPEQGTAEHRVEEVWVYSPTEVLGVYPLPATVTLPSGEATTLTLVPGIRANGIASTRRPYPFYTSGTVEIDGDPSTLETHEFLGSYVNTNATTTRILLAEDFDGANRFQAMSGSNASVVRITEPGLVFEGAGSGHIHLDSAHNQLNAATNEQFYNLPKDRAVYLEFHYKADVPFSVGLEVIGGSQAGRLSILVLNPSCDETGLCSWRKIYLDLYPALSSMPDAVAFEIGLNAFVPADGTEGDIWLDNFKFVHFDD